MAGFKTNHYKEIVDADISIALKFIFFIHSIETEFSAVLYKYWCEIIGHKFEIREVSRPNACVLVTKRSSHLFASLVIYFFSISLSFRKFFSQIKTEAITKPTQFNVISFNRIELELYELNCPEDASFGQGQKEHSFAFKKKENCVFCGRCLEIEKYDKKIVGKF